MCGTRTDFPFVSVSLPRPELTNDAVGYFCCLAAQLWDRSALPQCGFAQGADEQVGYFLPIRCEGAEGF